MLGVECHGATYHLAKSSQDHDRLREDVLEGLNWRIHRVWSTDWYRDPEREFMLLVQQIERYPRYLEDLPGADSKMNAPIVFLSYSHDSEAHKEWVRKLATDLRRKGVDVILDQWDLALGQDVAAFMQRSVASSDRVIMVCSEAYVKKADAGAGGVGYERLIITSEVVQNIDTKKFIPAVRENTSPQKVPMCIGPRLYVDFTRDENYAVELDRLLREIHNSPALTKPPLGANPFSASAMPASALEANNLMRGTSEHSLLDNSWFAKHANSAASGHGKLGFRALMELRYALHGSINKSQRELLDAVQKSEIRTFGWPIGITLENREEDRPQPMADGIRAEIAIDKEAFIGPSYDYWALRNTGDFYLLQSLFEDGRDSNAIFFNSRIVRVTESLLFAANLYEALGVEGDVQLSIRVRHSGFAGRALSSSNPTRFILPRRTKADESQVEIVEELGRLRAHIVEDVHKITAPLFMLFDFMEFDAKVYEEIVTSFVNGRAT